METSSNKSARRSQRDYTLGFKLSVVALVEKASSPTSKQTLFWRSNDSSIRIKICATTREVSRFFAKPYMDESCVYTR